MQTRQETVLVTGGASGIGLSVTRGLLQEGWKVLAADISQEALDAAAEALACDRVRCVRMDVCDEKQISDALAANDDFGPLAGLVSSAGIGKEVSFFDTDAALMRRMLEVNLIGTFNVAKQAALRMRERGQGSIVNIASVSGIRGNVDRTAYGASKGGVITMTRVMAVELAEFGIRVNVVAPGPVNTPLVAKMHSAASREVWTRMLPQRRYAEPQELSGTIDWLLDERRSSYVTGQLICVDGGFTAGGILRN
ncbi:MAG: SDR family NAD(P)-dependent oxidoreductase [Bordetella sp.]|uniref:SDR family NAD(P)-dependent oxidoreductase n=1 Tax=Bordetella sp. TaxID=28081 RepID=UPI003F7C007E